MNLIIEPDKLENELLKLGFSNLFQEGEGKLHLNLDVPAPKPFFKGEYYGQPGVYELIAEKIE